MTKYKDLCAAVTARIVADIEAGASAKDWRMPWHRRAADGSVLAPINASTGDFYQGGNIWALAFAAEELETETHTWATYNQWQKMGYQVARGQKATKCVYWLRVKDKKDETKTRLIPNVFSVHNACQLTEEFKPDEVETPELWDGSLPLRTAERLIDASGADIRFGGSRAFYSLSGDYVGLPNRQDFISRSTFYSTAFHELGHWTGHASRLDRTIGGSFGSAKYAAEELVAELASATLCAQLGVDAEPRKDHAQYVKSWLKVLNDDPANIMRAQSFASKAVSFLTDKADGEQLAA